MSLYSYDVKLIQEKYLQLLNLQGLKRHASGKWNFRCPLCGDSKTNPNKKRGWFNPEMKIFSCFNCGKRGVSFENYLEMVSPTLVVPYKQETRTAWLEDNQKDVPKLPDSVHLPEKSCQFDELAKGFVKSPPNNDPVLPKGTVPVCSLPEDHPARVWLDSRQIDMEKIEGHGISYCAEGDYENRIILPLVWKERKLIYGFQARALDDDKHPKYLTHLVDGYPAIWNMFNVNHDGTEEVHVTEGIFDAMFIPNTISLCGSDFSDQYMKALSNWNFCFIFDNDETGRTKSIKFAKLGYKVFVWPPDCDAKDVNEAILQGKNINFVKCFRAYSGAEAIVRIKLRR